MGPNIAALAKFTLPKVKHRQSDQICLIFCFEVNRLGALWALFTWAVARQHTITRRVYRDRDSQGLLT
jgi:hypothetical protein